MPYFVIGLAFLVAGFFPTAARAAQTITACGDIYTDVVLGANLRMSDSGTCLSVKSSNITINGNGKTITVGTGGRAVDITNRSGVTVTNLRTNGGIQVYGGSANGNRIQNSTLGGVAVYMGDDTVITKNRLTGLAVHGLYDDPAVRATITFNRIEGSANRLVDIMAGGNGTSACVTANHAIVGNTMINTATSFNPDSPIAFYYRCTKGSRIQNNYIRGTGLAQGIRMRDEADDNTIIGNTVWVSYSDRSALMISSGNADKSFPSRNIFRQNTFRASKARSLWIQAQGPDNLFEENLFWSRSWEGAMIYVADGTIFRHNTFANFYNQPAGRTPARLITWDHGENAQMNFYDNILYQEGGNARIYATDGFRRSAYVGHHNLYRQIPGPVNLDGESIADWDSAGSFSGQPAWLSVRRGNFSIAPSSDAVGRASDGEDIGAYSAASQNCSDNWLRPGSNPSPYIESATRPLSGNTYRLTVSGRNFRPGARVLIDRLPLSTTFHSPTLVSAAIPNATPAGWYDVRVAVGPRSCVLPDYLRLP